MGDKELETRTDGIEKGEASYSIISFPASEVPAKYKGVILAKWLRTLRYQNDYFKLVDPEAYYESYTRYISLLLSRPKSTVRLAVLSDDHDVVLGWILVEDTALHYVWADHPQRNQGIMTSLLPAKVNYITHLTKDGLKIWNSKLKSAKFNPFI